MRHPKYGFVYGTGYKAGRRRDVAIVLVEKLKGLRAVLRSAKTDKRYREHTRAERIGNIEYRIMALKIQMAVNYFGLRYLHPYEPGEPNQCQQLIEQRHPTPDGRPWRNS